MSEPERNIKYSAPPFVVGAFVVGLGSFAYLTLDLGAFDQGCAFLAVLMGTYLLTDDLRCWREKRRSAESESIGDSEKGNPPDES
jgi:hypothetical protein